MSDAEANRPNDAARVPLFGTWRNAYVAVVAVFLIEVGLFYVFSRAFS